jgi:phosphatidylglycerol:prolipoprotein diacylglycerol transferase
VKPLIPWFEPPVIHIPLGPDFVLPLHGFGLLVAIGFIVGGRAAMGRAKRMGLEPELINRLIGWLVVGTFIGGHVGYGLMYKPDEYLANPIEFLKVWQGLSSFGGFVVCVPLAIYFFWREKVKVWPYLDCLAYGMAVGWFFGRMGCFVAHDHPGTPTDFWLGVYGICQQEELSGNRMVACHDMGLYEALWSLSMFGAFTLMDRVRKWKPGTMVLTLGLAYGPVRFAMDYLRPVETDIRWGLFTPGQYWAAVFTLVCIGALVVRLRSSDEPIGPEPVDETDADAEPAGS